MTISKERWAEIAAIPDEEIDTSDIPELDAAFFEKARIVFPGSTPKDAGPAPIDAEIVEWFRAEGKGHVNRMNAVLRAYMLAREADK